MCQEVAVATYRVERIEVDKPDLASGVVVDAIFEADGPQLFAIVTGGEIRCLTIQESRDAIVCWVLDRHLPRRS